MSHHTIPHKPTPALYAWLCISMALGDGVNIAARLEGLAEAGGICISGTVYEQVRTKLAPRYEDLGEQAVKNIARPVRVYRVRLGPTPAASPVSQQEEGTAAGAEEAAPRSRGCNMLGLAVASAARDAGAGGVAAHPRRAGGRLAALRCGESPHAGIARQALYRG